MKKILSIIFASLLAVILVILVVFILNLDKALKKQNRQKPTNNSTTQPNQSAQKPALSEPISNTKSRVTKKPFGIYITPQTSPVQPEKFTGYHTGTDFETTSQEADAVVPVYAACTGKMRMNSIPTWVMENMQKISTKESDSTGG